MKRILLWLAGLLLVLTVAGAATMHYVFPKGRAAIVNPTLPPVSMEGEGSGPGTPFWPSSIKTSTKGTMPAQFFMDSKRCGECHADIYKQWQSSMHHFASFNNKFYSKSIEYMQNVQGVQGSKWCAGCHDHAVLLSGQFEKPMKDQLNTPEAQNGLGCISCHTISEVHSTMGNNDYTFEYPKMHDIVTSTNPFVRKVHDFIVRQYPEPHKRVFMKSFMKDNSEFCAGCHKVHLDVPVNNYRWFRGFNEYDNWQASGVSGQGARSFYYPDKPLTCGGCHMPLVPGNDPAAKDGQIHNHRFAAANTAVPHVNGDQTQLAAVEGFLKSGFITVDIFGASPADNAPQASMLRRSGDQPQLMSTFAVGEEAESNNPYFLKEVGKLAAPLDKTQAKFAPGSAVRMDVVVRTRKIGHFFPGGTVDAFDVWLELQGKDATGKVIYWSGQVEKKGEDEGPVERGAHFYRSYQLDGEGNQITKRNAWQTRSVLYVRLIPPGAADVAHYRVAIPKDAKGPITFTAKLNYRKFAHSYSEFVYDGKPPKGLPIVTLAKAETQLQLAKPGEKQEWVPSATKADRERWNDYGIGLLLQGDLKGAEYAFTRVTEAQPDYADGWLNVGRALLQEGEIDRAKQFFEKAIETRPDLARFHFFLGQAQKAEGDYDAALASMQKTAAAYPRDRVVQNQIGRILFLKRDYKASIETLQKVLAIDPEDLQANYNLMLAYRGLGDQASAARHEQLFRRFKADEAAQTITARVRSLSPEDNNERQQIHEHETVRLSK